VIAGDTTMAEVKALAEKYFGPIPARRLPPRQRLREPPSFAAREVLLKDPEVQQATWQRIYLTPPERENLQKAAALDLLSEILGGGPTSRLYRHLVVEQSLAVAVQAGDSSEAIDYGQFIIAAAPPAGVDTVKLEAGIDAEIALLLDKGIDPGELAAAKNRIAADAIKARDSLRGPAQVVGTALITGTTLEQVEAWPERIASVSAAEVLQAAKDVLQHKENSVTGALLPGEGEASQGPGPLLHQQLPAGAIQ
jgi:zinc protease